MVAGLSVITSFHMQSIILNNENKYSFATGFFHAAQRFRKSCLYVGCIDRLFLFIAVWDCILQLCHNLFNYYCFQFGVTVHETAAKVLAQGFCDVFSFLLGNYPGVKLVGIGLICMKLLNKLPDSFPKQQHDFKSSPAVAENSGDPSSLPSFTTVDNISYSSACVMVFHCGQNNFFFKDFLCMQGLNNTRPSCPFLGPR